MSRHYITGKESVPGGPESGTGEEDVQILENVDLRFGDNEQLKFGDGADVTIEWDGTNFEILPAADDTGSFNIGNGTLDIDFKVFFGDTTNYLQTDVGNAKVYLLRTGAGGDSAKGLDIDVDVLAGTAGFRQGAVFIAIDRASGQDFATGWDGNPDCALKIAANNRAVNAADRGAVRGIDVSARSRAGDVSWVNAINLNARVDSGCAVDALYGVFIRLEAYGTIDTEAIGVDVNLSVENDGGGGTLTGIRIRNTDASAQPAVDNVFLISHTSTNWFTNLFYFNGTTGDTVAAGDLVPAHDPDANSIGADAYAVCSINGTPY